MLKSEEKDCLWADGLMKAVREKGTDRDKAWDAFGKIYQKYMEALWTLCLNVCGNNGYADNVFGATWKKVWNSPLYDYNEHKVNFMTWLSAVAKRAWLDIKFKAVLGSDAEMPETSEGAKEFEFEEYMEEELPTIHEAMLENALHQLTEKEYDVLMTYIEYDTDKKRHVPDSIINELRVKYQTTAVNLRQIKCRALKKVKDYIEQHR